MFAIPILDSISSLARGTDAWLADVWGVIHNGVAPFAAAVEACTRFRSEGGTVLLLSNAPRPAHSVKAQLDRIGVARSAYDVIVSSGDAAQTFVADLGAVPVFHLGPERDLAVYDGLAAHLVSEASEAGLVVCTGLFDDDTETPDDYAGLLSAFATRQLPMVCANPDIFVERGNKLVYCAGAIAAAYERIGGAVHYAGKPYPAIYDMAFGRLAEIRGGMIEKERILAIGDGLNTDIKGAAAVGVRSVYIASAVSMKPGEPLDETSLSRLFPDPRQSPIAAMNGLRW